ncbi:MAG: hypothetical protein IKU07_01825 [Oscillospiraceae bacterium]|nr:hypothetical protein [Oscillospiraceae bacterium]
MKKLIALVLALVLTLSLAACGNTSKKLATEALDAASKAFNELADKMNEDIGYYEDSAVEAITEMALMLEENKQLLENSKEFTQEQLNELMKEFQSILDKVAEIKTDYGIE